MSGLSTGIISKRCPIVRSNLAVFPSTGRMDFANFSYFLVRITPCNVDLSPFFQPDVVLLQISPLRCAAIIAAFPDLSVTRPTQVRYALLGWRVTAFP